MMRTLSMFMAACLASSLLALAACGTISSYTGAVQTPAQIQSEICPPLTAALDVLTPAQAQLTATAQATLTKAVKTKAALCTATPAVFLSDLNTLPSLFTALPLIVNATSLPAQTKLDINLGIGAAKAAYDVIQSQTPTPALASSVKATQ